MSAAIPLPRVAAVTVSWNDAPLALRAVEALRASDLPGLEIVVVDNGSRPEHAARLRAGLGDATLIPLPANTGYTGGFNAGLRHAAAVADADLVVLVNSDAIVAPDAVRCLVEAADERSDAALIGALILAGESGETVLTAGGRLDDRLEAVHEGMGEAAPSLDAPPRAVDVVSGCVVLVRAATLPRLGYLDPSFFAYYEDVDWCLRARCKGLGVYVAPSARAWHPDTRARDELSAPVAYYMARNRLLLARKHAPGRYAAVLARLLRTGASWTLRPRWRHRRAQRDALARGIVDDLRGYRGAWRGPSPG